MDTALIQKRVLQLCLARAPGIGVRRGASAGLRHIIAGMPYQNAGDLGSLYPAQGSATRLVMPAAEVGRNFRDDFTRSTADCSNSSSSGCDAASVAFRHLATTIRITTPRGSMRCNGGKSSLIIRLTSRETAREVRDSTTLSSLASRGAKRGQAPDWLPAAANLGQRDQVLATTASLPPTERYTWVFAYISVAPQRRANCIAYGSAMCRPLRQRRLLVALQHVTKCDRNGPAAYSQASPR